MAFSMLDFLQRTEIKNNVPWKIQKINKNGLIIEENKEGKDIFLIVRGEVHIQSSITLADGTSGDKRIARLLEGEVFGELAIFDDTERSATAIAATDCELVIINGAALLAYMDKNPAEGYQVLSYFLKQIVYRMRQNNIRVSTVMECYFREFDDSGD